MPATNGDRIITVDRPIRPDDLGVTLPHERVFFDATETVFAEPDAAAERSLAHEPVSLENRSWIRRHPSMNRDNLQMNSTETVVEELRAFARASGDALVDVTPFGIGAAPERVRAVAKRTGFTTVQGTGYYVERAQPASLANRSVEDVAAEFVDAVSSGIGDTDVRAGIIGVSLNGRENLLEI